jgi:hypothetical protein
MDFLKSRDKDMSVTLAIVNVSRAVTAGYKVLATAILAYYLIKDTKERRRIEKLQKKKKKSPSKEGVKI